MGREWIIDVLADLRIFARENDLPLLTEQLEEAGLVAEVEIASLPDKVPRPSRSEMESGMSVPLKFGMPRRS
jgi:hypothetical protein